MYKGQYSIVLFYSEQGWHLETIQDFLIKLDIMVS